MYRDNGIIPIIHALYMYSIVHVLLVAVARGRNGYLHVTPHHIVRVVYNCYYNVVVYIHSRCTLFITLFIHYGM